MPKYMAIHVAILAGLVLAVTFLIFQSRALTFRLQILEQRAPAPERTPAPSPMGKVLTGPTDAKVDDDLKPTYIEGVIRGGVVVPLEPAKTTEKTGLTPAQEQAVAQSVEKILKEKYGHLPKAEVHEPLETVLERELNLTATQKERIADLLKKKQEESRTSFKGGNPFSGANLQRAFELDAKYEKLIKDELDAPQQAKYDQLKKDGKIGGGITIQIDAGGDE